MSHAPKPSLRSQGVDVFVVSLAMMMFEINLVRLFSVIMFYHLAFFVLAIALFGFGLGGLYSQLLRRRTPEMQAPKLLYFLPVALSLSMVAALLVLAVLPMNDASVGFQVPKLRWMLCAFLCAATPFFFGSMFMAFTFASRPADAPRLYFSDLLGAASGCLLAVAALQVLGGLNAPFFIAVAAALPSLRKAPAGGNARRLAALAAMVLVAGLGVLNLRTDYVSAMASSSLLGKDYLFSKWNFYSQISVKSSPWWKGWVLSDKYDGPVPEHLMIAQDSRAPAFVVRYDGNPKSVRYLRYDVTSMPYRIFAPGSMMIIGTGGGRDILSAKLYGVERIHGLELNHIIANDVMRDKFRDYSGNVYGMPGVNVTVESGRTFAHQTDERFDLTLISYADSQSSNTQGASVLSENHLYTLEGWQSYWKVLTENGVASAAVSAFWGDHMLPRMMNTMRAALEAEGVAEPEKHLLAVITPQYDRPSKGMFVAMCRQPVGDAVLEKARAACAELGYTLAWPPSGVENPYTPELEKLFQPGLRAKLVAGHHYDLTPLVDDRPYLCYGIRPGTFMDMLLHPFGQGEAYPVQLRTLHLLMDLFLVVFVCVLVLMVSPLVLFRRQELAARGGGQGRFLALFFLLGVGYVMIELALLQEFFLLLGDPTLTFALTLAAMLAFTGIGSFLSNRVRETRLARFIGAAAVLVLLLQACVAAVLPLATHSLLSAPLAARFGVVVLLLGVVATPMGMLFPSAIRLLGYRRIDMTCWAWGMNGIGSVLGSVGTTIISMNLGIHSIFVIGMCCYAAVALVNRGLCKGEGAAESPA